MPHAHSSRPVVVDTSASPQAQLRPVPLAAVTLTDRLWAPRRQQNLEVTLPTQYRLLEKTGRIDNFRRAAGDLDRPFAGRVYNDSDVYKWLEAAAWTLAEAPDSPLAARVDALIDLIAAAQQPDGYLNTYYARERAADRWSNLPDHHELYCAGHLIQAGIAHHRATGGTRLLDVARRFADLICDTFGPGAEHIPGVPGHPEIELALVELARLIGADRYLAQARYFVMARGRGLIGGRAYHGDHAPLGAWARLTGHAVRALYLCAAAADLDLEADAPTYTATLERLWRQMVTRQLYVSGGLGARHAGEAFGDEYELPNRRAYAETCAAIASVLWNWRMLQRAGHACYADLLELTLYNAFLPGLGLDGASYFYANPLASDGAHRRQTWYTCACCPTNVVRLLATLPGYFYSVSDADTVWIHLYAASEATITLPDGREVLLIQRTLYPWDGNITIEVLSAGEFTLKLRIPGWCAGEACDTSPPSPADVCSLATDRVLCEVLAINGDPDRQSVVPGDYVAVRRHWRPGDAICLRLPMPARRVAAHPHALENAGRIALMRGPLLYCLEAVDNPAHDLRDIALPAEAAITHTYHRDLLGGVVTLHAAAQARPPAPGWGECLYGEPQPPPPGQPVDITAVPYFAWANRAPGAMQVWLQHLP